MHDKEITIQTNFLVETLSAFVSGLWLIVQEAVRWFAIPQKKSVEGEIVLITGAGDGIGKSLAFKYAAAGATVVAVDINKKNVEELVKQIAAKGNTKAFAYVCDVANRDHVLAMAKQVEMEVGSVTILINNAGVLYANRIWDVAPGHVKKTFDVNVLSNFWTIEAFLPTMRKSNKGHIVALCSSAGLTGVKNLALYCSTKYAVRGLMESLRIDIRTDKGSKIKTTCVYPFMVRTDLCTRPSIRFQNLMPVLDKEYVAKCVISAQRREISDISVPFHLFFAEKIFRLLPLRLQDLIMDFLDITILPEEKGFAL